MRGSYLKLTMLILGVCTFGLADLTEAQMRGGRWGKGMREQNATEEQGPGLRGQRGRPRGELTEAQKQAMQEKRAQRMEALYAELGLTEAQQEQLSELRAQFRAQQEAMLTPEQVEKLEELREKRMARRGARDGAEDAGEDDGEASAAPAARMAVRGNAPNPFNPETQIAFELTEAANVRLTVFNSLGQKVETLIDEYVGAGAHSVRWDAHRMPSGLYFYRLEAGGLAETRRMMLLK